ncbi:hypothetical protein [Flavobacterium sp. JP2137]
MGKLINPMKFAIGRKFALGTKEGEKAFQAKALEIEKKYNLPTKF